MPWIVSLKSSLIAQNIIRAFPRDRRHIVIGKSTRVNYCEVRSRVVYYHKMICMQGVECREE
jgi:hypothetical protein